MVRNASTVYILIYVDDVLVASDSTEMIKHCEQKIQDHFEIHNLGEVKSYLGIGIRKTKEGNFKISQTPYILQIAKQLGLEKAKVSHIPISVGYGKGESNPMINNESYRKAIGCLLYVSINTRPDISAAVSILAQKVSSPTDEDWVEVKRVVKYLIATAKLELELGGADNESQFYAYADADWAGNVNHRKSNTGYVVKFGIGTVSWACRRQTCVALASSEAEFISLSETCKEVLWLRRLLTDFKIRISKPTTI